MSSSPAPGSGTRPLWVVVGVLLFVGALVPLLVPAYAKETPTLLGFPFFYWFQFLLIPVVSLLTLVAFRISQTATARDRAARGQRTLEEGER
jgi:uncharacterized membrane protein